MTLRSKLIRLAHENPGLRSEILPLLKEGGGPLYQDVQEAGRRILKTVKPGKDRRETMKLIGLAVIKDPVLMDWFYDRVQHGGGKLDYYTTREALGKTIANWKNGWEKDGWELSVGPNESRYDDLSGDPQLLKIIQSAVNKHEPVGAKISGINWAEVRYLNSGLQILLGSAQKFGGRELEEARTWVSALLAELSK